MRISLLASAALAMLGCRAAPTQHEGRSRHAAAWTGSEMLVWGGFGPGGALRTGAAFDPRANTWRPMRADGSPAARESAIATWTGAELLVWGGENEHGRLHDGAAYDPFLDRWRPLPEGPAAAGAAGAWTGREWVIWGGMDCTTGTPAVHHAYDPAQDRWRTISLTDAPPGRELLSVAWTGEHVFVFGGWAVEFCDDEEIVLRSTTEGGLYDPDADTWTPIASPTMLVPPRSAAAAGDGRVLLWSTTESVGAVYDLGSGNWLSMAGSDAPEPVADATVVWTGQGLLVFGGAIVGGGGQATDVGGVYDPVTDSWRPLPVQELPSPRYYHSMVWTGEEAWVWGGWGGSMDGEPIFLDEGGPIRP